MPEPWFLAFRICKGFGLTICQSWAFRCKRAFFFNFRPLFQVWLLFQVPHPHFFEKSSWLPGAEFNSESIGTKFKFQNLQTKKLVWQFLFALFEFLKILIHFVFIFLETFANVWEANSRLLRSRKISWNQGEKIRRLSPEGVVILESKQKKRYLIIYTDIYKFISGCHSQTTPSLEWR